MHQKLMTALVGLALSGAVLAAEPQVELKTTMGDIVLELDHDKAPKSVDNFLAYVKSGYYKNTIFHRVIDGFMIQGGGYDEKLKGKPTNKPIPLEASNGLHNVKYSLAMARMGDPNSATSQWFINVEDNAGLDAPGPDGSGGYAVFGKVIKGQETVDKIKAVLVDDKGMFQNLPVVPVVVKSATILKTPIQPKQ
ncbi:peptidyl-prolyl cis-trans isomerase [Duganella sp. FT109W]|uniref:Peptidyl-prolyl cis-trans isomerase n=2 Tax=Duganella margarita TaxID=2692170 RepID=A0A7X4KGY3_9BURK|nr:peptidylprolyl isomerase [Duganella margarita]MYM73059.1 peptidyl-prolyl cis-trans isomerase [Duganella margarita]MYN40732.1 peptidyl-prolyl cis-trans isomerase [Duganella margarita]